MAADDVMAAIRKTRSAADKMDRPALRRLVTAYGTLYRRLSGRVQAIAERAERERMTVAQVRQMPELRGLERATAAELDEFSGTLAGEIATGTRTAAALGATHAAYLLSAAVSGTPAAGARIRRPTADALDVMLDWTRPGSALRSKIDALAPFHAQRVADALVDAIAAGRNPQSTARIIEGVFGNGLTDALRMTRTSQLWAYRQATQLGYKENGVDSWVWFAQLDERTCLSCVSQHGTTHPADEILNDHHNGRCAMVPVVAGVSYVEQTGSDWFAGLDEAQQDAMLPAGLRDMYRAGELDWRDMSRTYADDVYGEMRRAATEKEILGAD